MAKTDGWDKVDTTTDSDTSRGSGPVDMPAPAEPWRKR